MFQSLTLRMVSNIKLDLVSSLKGENQKSPIFFNNSINNYLTEPPYYVL